jgi:hypothetical protein
MTSTFREPLRPHFLVCSFRRRQRVSVLFAEERQALGQGRVVFEGGRHELEPSTVLVDDVRPVSDVGLQANSGNALLSLLLRTQEPGHGQTLNIERGTDVRNLRATLPRLL